MVYKGHLGTINNLNMDYGLCHNTVSNYNVNFSDFYDMLLHDRIPIFLRNTEISKGKGKLCPQYIIKKISLHVYVCIYTQIYVCIQRK